MGEHLLNDGFSVDYGKVTKLKEDGIYVVDGTEVINVQFRESVKNESESYGSEVSLNYYPSTSTIVTTLVYNTLREENNSRPDMVIDIENGDFIPVGTPKKEKKIYNSIGNGSMMAIGFKYREDREKIISELVELCEDPETNDIDLFNTLGRIIYIQTRHKLYANNCVFMDTRLSLESIICSILCKHRRILSFLLELNTDSFGSITLIIESDSITPTFYSPQPLALHTFGDIKIYYNIRFSSCHLQVGDTTARILFPSDELLQEFKDEISGFEIPKVVKYKNNISQWKASEDFLNTLYSNIKDNANICSLARGLVLSHDGILTHKENNKITVFVKSDICFLNESADVMREMYFGDYGITRNSLKYLKNMPTGYYENIGGNNINSDIRKSLISNISNFLLLTKPVKFGKHHPRGFSAFNDVIPYMKEIGKREWDYMVYDNDMSNYNKQLSVIASVLNIRMNRLLTYDVPGIELPSEKEERCKLISQIIYILFCRSKYFEVGTCSFTKIINDGKNLTCKGSWGGLEFSKLKAGEKPHMKGMTFHCDPKSIEKGCTTTYVITYALPIIVPIFEEVENIVD